MKKHLKNLLKEIDDFFEEKPTVNQKAWGVINQFYHIILTYMEKNNISKAELARRLGKSRSAISQMFNKTPNVSIKRMVEIADKVGINLKIDSDVIEEKKRSTVVVFVKSQSSSDFIENQNISDSKVIYSPESEFKIKSELQYN